MCLVLDSDKLECDAMPDLADDFAACYCAASHFEVLV